MNRQYHGSNSSNQNTIAIVGVLIIAAIVIGGIFLVRLTTPSSYSDEMMRIVYDLRQENDALRNELRGANEPQAQGRISEC